MSNEIGIYKISCSEAGGVYIGSTIQLSKRWEQHLNSLRRKLRGEGSPHKNYKLYMDFKEHGEDTFRYEVIEVCSQDELPNREKHWIMYYNSVDAGYNIAVDTEYPFRGIKKNEAWHEHRDTEYHFVDPDGNEVKGKGLMKFCRENDLTQQAMGELLREGTEVQQNFGWRKYKPELVGIPFNRDEFTSNRLITAWSTSRAHQRGLQRKKLKFNDDEIYNMYHMQLLSIAQISKLCNLTYNGYIYKLLEILNGERNGKFREAGGKYTKSKRIKL